MISPLQITFNLLKSHNVHNSLYYILSEFVGGDELYGSDTLINMNTVMRALTLEDAVWTLRATTQDSSKVCRLFAADCAESVLHIFEEKYPDDKQPRNAIQSARDFANGLIGIEALKETENIINNLYNELSPKEQTPETLILKDILYLTTSPSKLDDYVWISRSEDYVIDEDEWSLFLERYIYHDFK